MHPSRLIMLERTRRLGWPGVLGICLIVIALIYAVLVVVPATVGLHRETSIPFGAAQPPATQPDDIGDRSNGGSHEVEAFRQGLPGQMDATSAINRIYALANAEGITLKRGEYSMGIDAKSRLVRYQMTLPLVGSYPQLRRFIHAVMLAIPAVALEDIDLRRDDIGTTQLEGRIRLTLYLSR